MAYKPLYDNDFFKNLAAQIDAMERKKAKGRTTQQRQPKRKEQREPNAAKAAALLLRMRRNMARTQNEREEKA